MKILTNLTILALTASGCSFFEDMKSEEASQRNGGQSLDLLALSHHASPAKFASCRDVQSYVSEVLKQKKSIEERYWAERKNQPVHHSPNDVTFGTPDIAEAQEGLNDNAGTMQGNTTAPDILTNNQESDVDEADFAKISSNNIYVVNGRSLQVSKRDDLAYIGKLRLPNLDDMKIFTHKDRLIVIGTEESRRTVCVKSSTNEKTCSYKNDHTTKVVVYKELKGELPQETNSADVIGKYQHARLTGGKLFLLTQDQLDVRLHKALPGENEEPGFDPEPLPEILEGETVQVEEGLFLVNDGDSPRVRYSGQNLRRYPIPAEPVVLDEGDEKVWGVDCQDIVKPVIDDTDFQMIKLVSVAVDKDLEVRQAASLGSGDTFYMTSKAAYVTKQGIYFNPWQISSDSEEDQKRYSEIQNKLAVTKFKLDVESGDIKVSSRGIIEGYAKDQWAFKEMNSGSAIVIATTDSQWSGGESQANNLFALREEGDKLVVASSIKGYGETETIRSIRYVKDIAYVVTFRETDPLFAFDLSDLSNIDLLGELHIPGFSSYLHPHGDEHLIGVGFDATDSGLITSLQVNLFDVADPTNPERIDYKSIGHSSSSSEATSDHKAFYYDATESLFAIPFRNGNLPIVNEPFLFETDFENDLPYWDHGYINQNSGAIFYKIDDDSLEEYLRVYHGDLVSSFCYSDEPYYDSYGYEVRRIFKIDGRVISVSEVGLKEHDVLAKRVVSKTVFRDSDDDCSTSNNGK